MKYQKPNGIRSSSQTNKPHKFFERYLDNDLEILKVELQDRYKKIEEAKVVGVTPLGENELWESSKSVSTIKWRQYNVFQFYIPQLYNLFEAVSEMTKEACDYYNINFKQQKYMIQGWFNINYAKNGKLDWHDHGPFGAPNFHGYYCVNAEPSTTHYLVFDKEVENLNKNNRAILSEMGHPHAQADWEWDGPRITVAYDIMPLNHIRQYALDKEQHWTPLL